MLPGVSIIPGCGSRVSNAELFNTSMTKKSALDLVAERILYGLIEEIC